MSVGIETETEFVQFTDFVKRMIDGPELGEDLRSFTHKRWVIVYRPTDVGIEVVGVVDGSQDCASYFRGK